MEDLSNHRSIQDRGGGEGFHQAVGGIGRPGRIGIMGDFAIFC
jgi:hypothetical protein